MTIDPVTQNALALRLRALHRPGHPLILANVYDAATATTIASLPTATAIATASYAIAQTLGVPDASLTATQNLSAVKAIAEAARAANPALPLTVDLQDGYADPGATVTMAITLGAVGCNIEDVDGATGALRSVPDAVARIRAVRRAAAEAGVPDFVVNARTDVLFLGGPGAGVEDAVRRGRAFLEAGAACVYVWGGPRGRGVSAAEVRELVGGLDGLVNVKMGLEPGFLGVRELGNLGVARVSVGPGLWRVGMAALRGEAERILGDRDA
ncbi:Pyruvate/Phosphoenolpyruvate kinase [Penicillium macrosclerotiorum]|uniref:Pyruvate/Phosphoenolpyruvate kinase n=1 Tax=Penicillium macrosclerotiorum TaxID=303699 RepID=UPI0025499321|nr:Pyruvate/Phosphoenolpyruvate kinase [Penicillium macrosclerotiorum]KAJ5669447.1 Pyruvate/Phosphoenolpyruvate kinase [Penicillium macrosclerotiorum]